MSGQLGKGSSERHRVPLFQGVPRFLYQSVRDLLPCERFFEIEDIIAHNTQVIACFRHITRPSLRKQEGDLC